MTAESASAPESQQTTPPELHHRTCHLCEAMCGLVIEHKQGEIISIKGDPEDPYSEGYICPKAVALQDIHDDADRLRQPMLRNEDGWEPISWTKAYTIIKQRVSKIQKKHGKQSVATYIGNPSVHNHGMLLMLPLFLRALGSPNRFSATSLDQLPHMLANLKVFGHQGLFPIPDINNTQYFLCIGGNPVASQGSLMSLPNAKKKLEAIKKRGGRVVVIDPRKSETAAIASEHYAIQPGTDPYLLLGLTREIIKQEWIKLGHLEAFIDGLEALTKLVDPFTKQRVSSITGISEQHIYHIAHSLAHAAAGAVYGRIGVCTQKFGSINAWLIHVLNTLTGNLDQPGGTLFTQPAIDLFHMLGKPQQVGHFDARRTKVRQLPEFSGEFPTAALAEEITNGDDGRIRSLITLSGNPVLSGPNGAQLDAALDKLDFMVSIDYYINETTRHAHLILPPTSPLERSHYDIIFHHLAIRNTAKYSPPLFQPADDAQHDWQILLSLTKQFADKSLIRHFSKRAYFILLNRFGIDGVLDFMLRVGHYGQLWDLGDRVDALLSNNLLLQKPYTGIRSLFQNAPFYKKGQRQDSISAILDKFFIRNADQAQGLSLAELKKHPHGLDLGPLKPSLAKKLLNSSRAIDLVPKTFQRQLKHLSTQLDQYEIETSATEETKTSEQKGGNKKRPYRLIGRRDVRSNNSWMHNYSRLVKGPQRCVAIMNPKDASRHRVGTGDLIRITSEVGHIDIPVETSDTIMAGVVSVPHGWGHNRTGTRLTVAEKHAGVSINDITDDQFIDQLTGVAAFNGLEVSIKKSPSKSTAQSQQQDESSRQEGAKH